jgi:hypothetical protein
MWLGRSNMSKWTHTYGGIILCWIVLVGGNIIFWSSLAIITGWVVFLWIQVATSAIIGGIIGVIAAEHRRINKTTIDAT